MKIGDQIYRPKWPDETFTIISIGRLGIRAEKDKSPGTKSFLNIHESELDGIRYALVPPSVCQTCGSETGDGTN